MMSSGREVDRGCQIVHRARRNLIDEVLVPELSKLVAPPTTRRTVLLQRTGVPEAGCDQGSILEILDPLRAA